MENNAINLQVEISKTEANIAFFEARFSLVQQHPDSSYKKAQIKAYQAMHEQLSQRLEKLNQQKREELARQKTAAQ